MDYVVAGGGLAGLTAAAHLAESGADVTVFERADRVGGRVASRTVDGYTLDRGFQVLFTAYPAVRRELDLDALDLRSFTPGATIARPGERSVLADPLGAPGEAIETLLNREVQFGDKLRVFRLQRALAGDEPADVLRRGGSTTADYLVAQGFSRAFVESFAKPFFGGITLDRTLGTDSAVFEYTFKMMAEGRTAVPADGMGAIPAQLAERARAAGARIETGRAVDAVDANVNEADGADAAEGAGAAATVTAGGETVSADGVVVATDPSTARELTGVDAIPTEGRGCVTQYVSLPSGSRPETDRRLVLNAAGDRPNHVAPLSRVAPEYAPEGRELYAAVFLGTPEAGDAALFDEVRSTLSRWYPEASFADLEHVATDRVPFAQFDQPPGFLAGLPAPTAPSGPVVLAGDYTRWSSIQGALESGRIAAETVLERPPTR
ncbi:NAD(P)/FAD-dependent oxidoreductase [Halomicrobium salinisoli]|uniref:NAD(P)/FAD-dependent oxidoreductase n=1 Tax=Halomicrobium salinisoli TaxID=2878391 RepID=UPI001CF03A67|nr:NAD(P)/FAD-dependent oxidoreductase [Halomicrobium salinisoli]